MGVGVLDRDQGQAQVARFLEQPVERGLVDTDQGLEANRVYKDKVRR